MSKLNIQIVYSLIFRLKAFVCAGFHQFYLFLCPFQQISWYFFGLKYKKRKYHYFIINCARDPAETNIKHNNIAVTILVAVAATAAAVFFVRTTVHVHKAELNTHS